MNTKQQPSPRWYVVRNKSDGGRCLVEANNRAQAFRRAGEHYCTAEPATVADTIDMIRNDCDVISAPQVPEQPDIEDVTGETSAPVVTEDPGVMAAVETKMNRASFVFAQLPSGDPDEK